MSLKERAQKWLLLSLEDPIAKILATNSNLTKIQLETLLIDILAEGFSGKSLKYEEKAKLRISTVSRGAFNRTLRQARRNMIQAVYTVLLLGYLGFFENAHLDSYLEVANKLQNYMEAHRNIPKKKAKEEHYKIISMLHYELKTSLERLSKPRSVSRKV